MSQPLSVLITTNDPSIVSKIDTEKVPLTTTDIKSRNDIGMTLDMYLFDNDLSAYSRPAFVIPSSALSAFTNALWMPALYIWTMQAALSIKIHPRLSHNQDSLETHLLDPILNSLLAPTFVGVSIDSSISVSRAARFQQRCVGKYAAEDHLKKLQSLQIGGAVAKVNAGLFLEAVERYAMAIRYTHVLWECHLPLISDAGEDLRPVLWGMTVDGYADRTQVLLNAASANTAESRGLFVQARKNAEEGIEFLNIHRPFKDPKLVDETMRESVRKAKAKVAFRAAVACEGLAEREVAVGYLRLAMQFEPESEEKLRRKMEELGVAKGKEVGREVVLRRDQMLGDGACEHVNLP